MVRRLAVLVALRLPFVLGDNIFHFTILDSRRRVIVLGMPLPSGLGLGRHASTARMNLPSRTLSSKTSARVSSQIPLAPCCIVEVHLVLHYFGMAREPTSQQSRRQRSQPSIRAQGQLLPH